MKEIVARFGDRFRLLSIGSRTALSRHQTLQAMVDWSHDLLIETEQVLSRRLSVFSGGWTLEAAESVCADEDKIQASNILDLLASLGNKSLIIVERKQGEETRYSMLETIRQYADEKLWKSREKDWIRHRHLAYFVKLAERGDKQVHGPDQIEWMDRLEKEIDNFCGALDWSVAEQHAEAALRLLDALSWTWAWRGYFIETENGFNKVRVLPGAMEYPELLAGLLNQIGSHFVSTDIHYARSVLEESQEIWLKLGRAGEQGLARALEILGQIALFNDKDIRTAQSLFESSFELYQKYRDELGMAWLINRFGNLAYVQEHYKEAEEQCM